VTLDGQPVGRVFIRSNLNQLAPEMNGFEAVAAIRALEHAQGRPHTPIVAVTAHAMVGDRERCLEAGMDAYLSKPLRRQLLLYLVDELLGANGSGPGPTTH
jgi:CheY-like chemotaxis protein